MYDAAETTGIASRAFRSSELDDAAVAAGASARSGLKRVCDILASGLLLLVMGPALLLMMLLIRVESPGPAIFAQRRTGLGGKVFTIYKLRTMRVMEDGPVLKHAVRDDARVTRFGAILRRTSLDELPQLINVLKGDMSMIGPRPHALAHDQIYGAVLPQYRRRFAARPGLTGLAQVHGLRGEVHGAAGMAERVAKDVEYCERWTIWLDLKIALKTVPVVLRALNAY